MLLFLVCPVSLQAVLFPDADRANGWVNVPELGWLYEGPDNFYYHKEHGWMYLEAFDGGEDSAVAYSYNGQYWWFVSPVSYPWAFRYDLGEWGQFVGEDQNCLFRIRREYYSGNNSVVYRISKTPGYAISPFIFGQLLERPSWGGENGPEAVVDPDTGTLPSNVVDKLQQVAPTIVRFPGGTDVDLMDWTDMIDNVPGRDPESGRPVSIGTNNDSVTNFFGYDEFFELRDALGFEPLIVVNLGDAFRGRRTIQDAAMHAAGLVAYCNAPVGAELPEGMPDWPAVRAANGHSAPFGVKYWQIGNETWSFIDLIGKVGGAQGILEIIHEYIAMIKAVDPDIQLIFDGELLGRYDRPILEDEYFRNNISHITYHTYGPWNFSTLRFKGIESASTDDWWQHWVLQPAGANPDGRPRAIGDRSSLAIELGYQVASTEWNWNGWGYSGMNPRPTDRPEVPMALGTAAHIHGMMREGEHLTLATQSILLGTTWGITAIRVDSSAESRFDPWLLPQGQAFELYNRLHGDAFLPVDVLGSVPWFVPPIPTTRKSGGEIANFIDLIATSDANTLFLHVYNLHRTRSFRVQVDLSEFENLVSPAIQHTLSGPLNRSISGNREILDETDTLLDLQGDLLEIDLPPHSISIIEMPIGI